MKYVVLILSTLGVVQSSSCVAEQSGDNQQVSAGKSEGGGPKTQTKNLCTDGADVVRYGGGSGPGAIPEQRIAVSHDHLYALRFEREGESSTTTQDCRCIRITCLDTQEDRRSHYFRGIVCDYDGNALDLEGNILATQPITGELVSASGPIDCPENVCDSKCGRR